MQPPCFIIGRTARASRRIGPVSSTLDSGIRLIRARPPPRGAPLEYKTKTERPRQWNAAVHRSAVLFAGIQRRRRRIEPTRRAWQSNQGPPPTGRQISAAISARSARAPVLRTARRPALLAATSTQRPQSAFPSRARRSTTGPPRSVQALNRRLTWRSTGPATAYRPWASISFWPKPATPSRAG